MSFTDPVYPLHSSHPGQKRDAESVCVVCMCVCVWFRMTANFKKSSIYMFSITKQPKTSEKTSKIMKTGVVNTN